MVTETGFHVSNRRSLLYAEKDYRAAERADTITPPISPLPLYVLCGIRSKVHTYILYILNKRHSYVTGSSISLQWQDIPPTQREERQREGEVGAVEGWVGFK